MAVKYVKVGSIGPFRFDDATYKGVESDGEIAGDPIGRTSGYSGSFDIVEDGGSPTHNFTFTNGLLTSYSTS